MISSDKKKPAIGIDLGTTNSLAAFSGLDGVKTLDGQRGAIVPSVISFTEGNLLIGHPAKEAMIDNPEHTVYSIKRLLGKSAREFGSDESLPFRVVPDPRGLASVEIDGRLYSPVELSAVILKEVKRQAEKVLGSGIDQAVITVPAYFDDAQRQATRDAGKIAGLDVLRIINEPTAAALAYGLDKKDRGNIVVYDLGGGTFDVSILRLENGIFEVLSTAGDTSLGGDDFDNAIIEYIVKVAAARNISLDLTSPRTAAILKQQAEKAKIALSKTDAVSIPLPSGDEDFSITLSRNEFENLISHLLRRTLKLCRQALADASLSRKEIDEVILVGGSTRMPNIKKAVGNLFDCNTHSDLGPDEVVARGAAIQAEILTGGRDDLLLLDVTPLSLGIEMMGGVMSTLIKRNAKVPAVAREVFTTYVDGQTSVAITVYQGERELVADNRRLGNFSLTGIAPQPAGAPRIEVSFMLDADGILKVSARDVKSGIEQVITIHPTYGLARDSIDKMVRESFVNAREDINRRLFIELSQEAEKVIGATEKAFELFDRIGKDEKEDIENSISELKDALKGGNAHLLREKLDDLNDATTDLASRMAGDAFSEALSDKSVEEAKGLIK